MLCTKKTTWQETHWHWVCENVMFTGRIKQLSFTILLIKKEIYKEK